MPFRRQVEVRDATAFIPFLQAATVLLGSTLMMASTGCEKVPTFKELTQQGQTTAPTTTESAPAAKAPIAQTPVVQTPPVVENPQQVIDEFKNTPPHQRTDNHLKRLANVASGSQALIDMDLTGSTVSDEGLKNLAKLTQLETLGLSATRVTDAGLSVTNELPQLKSLNLTGCTVTLAMMTTISKLEKLEVLSLESAKITDLELPPLENLAELKDLNLNYCVITDNGFKVLGKLKKLEVLKVAYTNINGSGMQYMKRKRDEGGLRVLDAKKTRFGEQGLQFLKGVETLEELDVGQAEVTDRTLFQHLKGVTHLKKLNLSFNNLSDNGTSSLGAIKSLEELYLRNCQGVGDKTLGVLKASKELKILDVNGCNGVTDKGTQLLKKFLQNCEIRYAGRSL